MFFCIHLVFVINYYFKEFKILIEFNSNFLGDDDLRHRVVFERGSLMNCIYCSLEATTREHVPSKVFLSKPLP